MRLTPPFVAALLALAALSACGTKTPLTLPPPVPATTGTASPATDHNNKAVESRQ